MAKRRTQAGKAYAESMQSQGTTQDYAAVRTALAWLENAGKNALDTLVKLSEVLANLSGVFGTMMDAGEQAFAYLAVGIAAVTAAVAYAIDIHEKLMAKLHALSKLGIDTFFVWYNAAKARSAQMAESTGSAMMSAAKKVYAFLDDASRRMFSALRSGTEAAISAIGRALSWIGGQLRALPGYAASAARGVSEAIQGAVRAVQGWADSVASVGSRLVSLASVVTSPLESAGKQFAAAGAGLSDMAERSGLTVEALQEIGYAAQLSGSSMEAAASAAEKLNEVTAQTAAGSQEATAAFDALGLSADKLAGMTADRRFETVAGAIWEIRDASARAAVAQQLLGSASEELINAFAKGPEAFRAMRREAQELGLVMGGDAAKNAKELTQQWKRVQAAMDGLWRTVGAAVAPALIESARLMTAAVKIATQWAKENQPLIASVFRVASAIATVGTVLASAGWVPLLTAMGGALYGVVTAWGRFGERIMEVTAVTREALGQLAAWTGRAMDGIRNAILGGRVDLAAKIAWNALALAWVNGLRGLAAVMPKGIEAILLPLAAGNFADAGRAAWLGIETAFLEGVNALQPSLNTLRDAWDAIVGYMEKRWNDFMSALSAGVLKILNISQRMTAAVAKYDLTGLAAAANRDLNAIAIQDLAARAGPGDLSRRNAAIDDQMTARKAERDALADAARQARQAEIEMRRMQIEALGEFSRPGARDKALAIDKELQDAQQRAADAAAEANQQWAEMQRTREANAGELAKKSKDSGGRNAAFVTFSAAAALAMSVGGKKEKLDEHRNKLLTDIWAVNHETLKFMKENPARFA